MSAHRKNHQWGPVQQTATGSVRRCECGALLRMTRIEGSARSRREFKAPDDLVWSRESSSCPRAAVQAVRS